MIEELQKSGIVSGKRPGEKAADFKLTNALGRDVILFEELAKGPVVLVFYRGGWCPFCNMQLKAKGLPADIAGNPADRIAAYSD